MNWMFGILILIAALIGSALMRGMYAQFRQPRPKFPLTAGRRVSYKRD